MNKTAVLFYGVVVYLIFLATFLYAIGFVGNLVVPKSIDSGTAGGISSTILINVILLGLFAVQHTVMARPAFKRWWTRFVPEPIERSTFVLLASVLLALMMWLWRPLPDVIWSVEGPLRFPLWILFFAGWGIVLLSTYLIDHFDLFGLRQVWIYSRGDLYSPPRFVERSLYRFVRHPLMLGFVIAFWATPRMTEGHLLFAAVTTIYILIAIQIEERDLVRAHGEAYVDYRRRVSMIIPRPSQSAHRAERA